MARAGNHPNVLRMLGYCSARGYILSEYAANGSAEDVLIVQRKFMTRDELVFVLQVQYLKSVRFCDSFIGGGWTVTLTVPPHFPCQMFMFM